MPCWRSASPVRPSFARLCQTLVAGVASRDFVAAARIGGVGRFRVLTRHILPNIGEPLIVNATIGAGGALLAFAGLSFLGLGVQPPEYDWGRLMMEGLLRHLHQPARRPRARLAVVIAGLAFNLVGEAAARALGIESAGVVAKVAAVAAAHDAGRGIRHPLPTDVVLDVRDLTRDVPRRARTRVARARRQLLASAAARPSASSANRVRASP